MSVKRVDFIAHVYVEEDDIPAEMPLESFLAGRLTCPALGAVHVHTAEHDECNCCTYGDCGRRKIPR